MKPWLSVTINYDEIRGDHLLGHDLNAGKIDANFNDLRYLNLYSYKEKKSKYNNFYDLEKFLKLISLDLSLTNITDFMDVSNCKELRRLNVDYCRNLSSWEGITNLAEHLEVLCIDHAKKLSVSEELYTLKNLKILKLCNIQPIENLDFLKHFPNLETFIFVDTNVLSGNLTPIIEHPNITYAGFLNKRHYNMKDEQVDRLLAQKRRGY